MIELTSATGYAVGDEIEVTTGSTKQYGYIKSIDGDEITLYEGLSSNTTPSAGDAVAKVESKTISIGALASPADIAIKVSKTLVGGYGTKDVYLLKAQASSEMVMSWPDGQGNIDVVGLPFQFDAIADDQIESGKIAHVVFTQT